MTDPGRGEKLPAASKSPGGRESALVPMSGVHSIAHVIKRKALETVGILAVSAATAAGGAHIAQTTYREFTDFDPKNVPAREVATPAAPEPVPPSDGSWLDAARDLYQQTKQQIRETMRFDEVKQKYFDAKFQLEELRYNIYRTGDIATYWAAFVLTFMSVALILNKLLASYKQLAAPNPRAMAQNIETLAAQVEALQRQVAELQTALAAGNAPESIQDADQKIKQLSRQMEDIELSTRKLEK